MAGEPYITVIGNLAADPELRFTQSGHAVANFTIAQTPRNFDRNANEWIDDETLWVRATVWREAAENVAETLQKGTRVIAHGRLKARSFEDKNGNQRTNWELEVDEIGPSLRWATAQVNRAPRQNGGGGYAQNQGGGFAQNQAGGFGQGQGGGFAQPQNGGVAQPQNGGVAQPQNQGGGYAQPPAGQPQNAGFGQVPPAQAGDPWAGGQNPGWDQGNDSPPPF